MFGVQFVPQCAGALDSRSIGTAAERATKTQPNYDGQQYFETDTRCLYIYIDGNWVRLFGPL